MKIPFTALLVITVGGPWVPVAKSGSTIRLTTRFILLLHGDKANLRQHEQMEDLAHLVATPAAQYIGHRAITKVSPQFALPSVAIYVPGRGHLPGYTCPLKAYGEAECMMMVPSTKPASDRGSAAPRFLSTSMAGATLRMPPTRPSTSHDPATTGGLGHPRTVPHLRMRRLQLEGGLTPICSRLGPVNSVQGAVRSIGWTADWLLNTPVSASR